MKRGLVSAGLTTLDVVARPIDTLPEFESTVLVEGIALAPAGTAAGAAYVAAKLGMDAALIGAVGDDLAGRFVRMALDEAGVDTALLKTEVGSLTSTTVLAVDSAGRRPNFHALGAGGLARITEAAMTAVRRAKFLHYAGIGGRGLDKGPGAGLVKAAREAGAIVTCDLISPRRSAFEELKTILPNLDYFMPSATEALALTGLDDLQAAGAAFLALGARGVIIKNGRKGSMLMLDGTTTALPAFAITPVDTTSCGDSYCAGFIAALDRGWPPLEAARFATATAALVAEGLATLGRLESFDATLAAMRQMTPTEETA
ncbi:MAG TPA: carbohydrate kinase family protein [Caulobacteraceae bacterium]|jgi:sugar/nucleoside kinase (ribokinase family)|nr:carbohydrate kinase family protein [Caulobacteraceae bacterium]